MTSIQHPAFTSTLQGYRFALDISPVPMLLASPDGHICHANPALCDLFGYELDALSNQSVEILVPESARHNHPELRRAYGRFPTKRRMGANRDLHGVTRDGNVVPLDLGLEPVEVDGQNMTLLTAIDISQRKAVESRVQLAIDAATSAMIMTDSQRTIVLANAATEALFGYNRNELIGQSIDVLVPEKFKRVHPVYMNNFMSKSRARSMGAESELVAIHKDGHPVRVEIALTPVDTPEGPLVMSTIIDLTTHLATNKALKARAEELEALNTELAHFAYSASHDLKAPMLTIKGLLTVCKEDLQDNLTDDVLLNLDRATDICNRSGQMISNVLAIARAGKDKIKTEHFALEPVIKNIWHDITSVESVPISLQLEVPGVDFIETELVTLKVILSNLLVNAVQFIDSGKPAHEVVVGASLRDNKLVLTVKDNGIGIPVKFQSQIFDMFKRFDQRSGSGLGLSLVHKHVLRLGGSISLDSVEGEYTCFDITLPLGEQQAVDQASTH